MKKKTISDKPLIDYKNALIAVLIILGVFTAGQLGSSIPMILVIANKTYTKLVGYILLLILYIDCLLALLVGSILGYVYSKKSMRNSQKKTLGLITLLSTIVADLAIIAPIVLLVINLLPR